MLQPSIITAAIRVKLENIRDKKRTTISRISKQPENRGIDGRIDVCITIRLKDKKTWKKNFIIVYHSFPFFIGSSYFLYLRVLQAHLFLM